ncbi:hypothetical protein [Absidia glauca]|uniref:Mei2-like C-terminal RNA recognition motif domain-containing protein n=1 Tax=Absidia glauca TaxID=4829 RepID=A0A168T772_ABSGL|nr:hypothetical protein [Absidia glauca]
MTGYLEQLEQLEQLWAQSVFNPFPDLWSANGGEKPLSFNPVVGAQKDLTLCHTVSRVWKPLSPRHTEHDSCDSSSLSSAMSSSASLLTMDQKELNHQSSRNILITNIPQESYHLVVRIVNTFTNIKDMREQSDGNYIKMVVIFYDLQHVSNVYTTLAQFIQARTELRHVALDVCNDLVVNFAFGLTWYGLQDTRLYVTLYGDLWDLRLLDYKRVLETYGTLRYHKQSILSENEISLVVEYSDTRATVAAQKALDGLTIQDVTFHAYLSKPDMGRPQSLVNRAQLQVIPEYSELASKPKAPRKQKLLFSAWPPKQDMDDLSSLAPNFDTLYDSGPPVALSLLPSTTHQQKQSSLSKPSSRFMFANQQPATLRPSATYDIINPVIKDHFTHLPPCTSTDRITLGRPDFSALDNALTKPLVLDSKLPPALFPCNTCATIPAETTCTNKDLPPAAPVRRAPTLALPKPPTPKIQQAGGRSQHASQHSNAFNVDRIISGQDTRTTFMIRNIPNKYNQAMLAECIDATHKGTYDFLYLRIDFQNKCNVGYAFINFMDPRSVVSFASQRLGKQWNRFHSEKLCDLAYANIQGKLNLIQKFRNSTVMAHDVTYRPKIYYSNGIHQGEEEPFPGPNHARPMAKT